MITLLAAATLVAAPFATPVQDAPVQTATRSVAVSTAGLDLTHADGRAKLDRRIARAARDLCAASSLDLVAANRAEQCRAALIAASATQRAEAIAQAGVPVRVTAAR